MGDGISVLVAMMVVKDFQSIVTNFISDRKRHMRYLALLTVLCLVVSIVVPASLIEPAISMTSNEYPDEYVQLGMSTSGIDTMEDVEDDDALAEEAFTMKSYLAAHYYNGVGSGDTSDYIYSEANGDIITVPKDSINLEDKERCSIAPNDSSDSSKNTTVVTQGTEDTIMNFVLKYGINKEVLTTTDRVVYYELPAGITVDGVLIGRVNDDSSTESGTFYIGQADNGKYYIVIEFDVAYITEHSDKLNHYGLKGTVKFNATANRGDSDDDTKAFSFGGVKIDVPFTPKEWNMQKSGTYDKASNTITWTITLSTTDENPLDLTGYTITDDFLAKLDSVSDVSVKSGDQDVAYSRSGSTLTLSPAEGTSVSSPVTITYRTEGYDSSTKKGDTVENSATLSSDKQEDVTKTAKVTIPSQTTLAKTGMSDYEYDGAVKGEMVWKITVTNNYNNDVEGYTLTDEGFSNAVGDILVNGKAVVANGDDLTFTLPTGTTTITYRTVCETQNGYSTEKNTVSDNSNGSTPAEASVSHQYQPYTIKKSGDVNSTRDAIVWTVKVSAQGKASLKGFEITDYLTYGGSYIEGIASNLSNVTSVQGASAEYNASYTDLTDSKKQYISVSNSDDNVALITILDDTYKYIEITYTTPVSESTYGKYSNTATNNFYYSGNENTKTVTYESRKTITKEAVNSNVTVEQGDNVTLDWKVNVVDDNGIAGKTITDTLGDDQSISDDQLQDIMVKVATNGGSQEILSSDYYTVARTGDTGFTITFKEQLTEAYTSAEVTYSTTGNTSNTTKYPASTNNMYEFKNTATYDDDKTSEKTNYVTVTDSNTTDFKKYALRDNDYSTKIDDSEKSAVTRKVSELKKVTFDDGQYYVLSYAVEFNDEKNGSGSHSDYSARIFVDTLPEGFTLCEDSPYQPKYTQPSTYGRMDDFGGNCKYTTSTDGDTQIVNFALLWTSYMTYNVKIPINTFNELYLTPDANGNFKTIVNSIHEDIDGSVTVTQRQTITNDTTQVEDKSLLDKSATSKAKNDESITYSIDVNPNAENLSNGDTITLTDVLSSGKYQTKDGNTKVDVPDDNLDVVLSNLTVSSYDESGKATPLDSNQYSYTFSTHATGQGAASISLTVPDNQRLLVKYTYSISNIIKPTGVSDSGAFPASDSQLSLSNSIELSTKNYTSSSTNNSWVLLNQSASATSSTLNYPSIEKVDGNNYNTLLDATFTIEKYVNGSWVYGSLTDKIDSNNKPYHEVDWVTDSPDTTSIADIYKITTTTDGEYYINLQSNALYRLKEVETPTGYIQPNAPVYFVYGSASGITIPAEVSTYMTLQTNGTLMVPNYKKVSVTATKEWADGNESHSADSVTVQLYSSSTKVDEGFPSNMTAVADKPSVELNTSNNWTYTWDNLSNGNGTSIYYYVKETAYKVNGTTYRINDNNQYVSTDSTTGDYQAYYSTATTTGGGKNVTIRNCASLEVKKVWSDASTNNHSSDTITFRLKSTGGKYIKYDEDTNTYSLVDDASDATGFKLNSDNGWTMSFENLPNNVNYTVEEDKVIGYSGVVMNNSSLNTGTITIKNTKQTSTYIQVEKVWDDDDAATHPAITLQLQYRIGTNGTWQNYSTYVSGYKDTKTYDANADDYSAHTFTGLKNVSEDGKAIYYRVIETTPTIDGYLDPTYDYDTNIGIERGKVTVTNEKDTIVKGYLQVEKDWDKSVAEDDEPSSVDVQLYRSTKKIDGTDTSSGGSATHEVTFEFYGSDEPQETKVYTVSDNSTVSVSLATAGVWASVLYTRDYSKIVIDEDEYTNLGVYEGGYGDTTYFSYSCHPTNWAAIWTFNNFKDVSTVAIYTTASSIGEVTITTSEDVTEYAEPTDVAISSTDNTDVNEVYDFAKEVTKADGYTPKLDDLELVETINITKSSGWKSAAKEYPTTDRYGNTYYYYIYEESNARCYPIEYSASTGKMLTGKYTETDPAVLSVTNTIDTDVEVTVGVTMPSTGGSGTMQYYSIGGAIVTISALALLKKRNKRK